MRIRCLSLTNFRNYARLELTLPERPLLLHGANAQGKTSLLEAIYLLATGSSPLTSLDRQLIRWEAKTEGLPYARVWAEVAHRNRIQELDVTLENKPLANGSTRMQKTIRVDRVRKRRADLVGLLNVVLFMPQDVELVAGPPAGRRRYMDDTLCQVDGDYYTALDSYTEALRQRNAALRHLRDKGGNPAQLAPFEETLARQGIIVTAGRRELLAALSQRAHRIHQQLTGGAEWLRLKYHPNFGPPPSPKSPPPEVEGERLVTAFQQTLLARRRDEIARGMTLVGPHRDDMSFIAGHPAQGTHEVDLGDYGSRGQQRTAVLALKLAELAFLQERTGESPVLLLDEVLAELDATRRRHLLAQVNSVEQALLTATNPDMFSAEFRERAALWEVRGGIVKYEA
ncbi:MAG: DNA replication/repair protein RecF [Chloroflexi bacterium]|nr:MAG: DNA replication/repair protein RecF [Chloroflexota bacterium]HEY71688.1 DNA replication/repair protein RecF [Thermoflexia bacterium]